MIRVSEVSISGRNLWGEFIYLVIKIMHLTVFQDKSVNIYCTVVYIV